MPLPFILPPQDGSSALFFACGRANLSIVNALLNAGASCSAANSDGQLPAHFAAQVGSVPVLQALAAHGASLVAPEDSGELKLAALTPACFAARSLLLTRCLSAHRLPGCTGALLVEPCVTRRHPLPSHLMCRLHPAALRLQVWSAGGGSLAAGEWGTVQPGGTGRGPGHSAHPGGRREAVPPDSPASGGRSGSSRHGHRSLAGGRRRGGGVCSLVATEHAGDVC